MSLPDVSKFTSLSQHARRIPSFVLSASWVSFVTVVTLVFCLVIAPVRAVQLTSILMSGVRPSTLFPVTHGFIFGFVVAVCSGIMIPFLISAIVIFVRRPNDPIATFIATSLVVIGASFPPQIQWLVEPDSVQFFLIDFVETMALIVLHLVFYTFPNGQFVPRWTRYFAFVWTTWYLAKLVYPGTFLEAKMWPPTLWFLWGLGWGGLGVYVQIYRYRYVFDAIQRQQAKWAVFGWIV